MKRLFVALAIFALAGCATTTPSNSYRAVGQIDAWQIGGEGNHATGSIKITINGKTVIDDSLGLIASDSEFNGTYQGKAITANCGYISAGMSRPIQCMIFVNNERATTLRF